MKRNKTGGGVGTNQHRIRGTSKARGLGSANGESKVVLADFTRSNTPVATNEEAAEKLISFIHRGDELAARRAAASSSPLLRTIARHSGLVDERSGKRTAADIAVEDAIAS
ncbi:hypothetical protein [Nesterenkonia rhizosphaerae]|uniref:Uncharacterized protein n=1 Tax=Nesterenkonia rhizosphaerae TaxID=1348272 RepID=A0ABP9G0Q2_9MICC